MHTIVKLFVMRHFLFPFFFSSSREGRIRLSGEKGEQIIFSEMYIQDFRMNLPVFLENILLIYKVTPEVPLVIDSLGLLFVYLTAAALVGIVFFVKHKCKQNKHLIQGRQILIIWILEQWV